ncbi:hypothetical protein [Pelomicrobium sp.]|uniref:hypothetical protein n=1 Tax=Pelomicrobium sp. TaxID=2815319 RepID=UPI002FDEEC26
MHALHRHGPLLAGLGLAALMAATRSHSFGPALPLPDASWAVFFLAGMFLRSSGWFATFLAEAAAIDFLAITAGGVSGWCVTPAYPFLAFAYGALWLAGRGCGWHGVGGGHGWARAAAALFVGVTAAFLISNGSFYLLSGYFPTLSGLEYAARVARYYPRYALSTFFYAALILVGYGLLRWLAHPRPDGVNQSP